MQNVKALSSVAQSAHILSRTILFKGNLAQPRKFTPRIFRLYGMTVSLKLGWQVDHEL